MTMKTEPTPGARARVSENDESRAEVRRLQGLLWYAWHEFNAIRACSGAPLNHDRMRTTTEEWWDQMTEAFRAALPEGDRKPWPSAAASEAIPSERADGSDASKTETER
jgi:hypothetical protein